MVKHANLDITPKNSESPKYLLGLIGAIVFLGGLAYCFFPVGLALLKWIATSAPEPGVSGEGVYFLDTVSAGIAEAIGRPGFGTGLALVFVGWCLYVWVIVTDSSTNDDSGD